MNNYSLNASDSPHIDVKRKYRYTSCYTITHIARNYTGSSSHVEGKYRDGTDGADVVTTLILFFVGLLVSAVVTGLPYAYLSMG